MAPGPLDRRAFLRTLAIAAAGTACTRSGPRAPQPPLAADDPALAAAEHGLQVFPGGQEFLTGPGRVSFGLADPDGLPLSGGDATAWVGLDDRSSDSAPLTYRTYLDPQGTDPAGFYTAEIVLPGPGIVTFVVERDGQWGSAVIRTREEPLVRGAGMRAASVVTPTFERPRGVAAVCTRDPACPMHTESLDQVLGVMPVVLTIASPKYCSSRTCGPVVDEITAVRRAHPDEAAFIHAEVYATDGPERLSATSLAWEIDSEPWTFVIDSDGMIAARVEGPVIAAEVEMMLEQVL